jgi:PQQ-dependent catabolism-associated beta-propeller protein
VVDTDPVGQRPRGINLSPDGKYLYILASDDNTVQVMDTETRRSSIICPPGPIPELGTCTPSGNPLYVANEDDNLVTAIDVENAHVLAEIPVGIEPEGMGVSPDGKVVVNTSETTNMAHFIDTETFEIFANILVDQRPRFAEYTADGSLLYVSAEIGGTVSVIDPSVPEILHKITFDVPGIPPEALQPVGVRVTSDGKKVYVALGPSNRVALVNGETWEVEEYFLVGQRVWQLAFTPDEKFLYTTNGISNDVSVIDVERTTWSSSRSRSASSPGASRSPTDRRSITQQGGKHEIGWRRMKLASTATAWAAPIADDDEEAPAPPSARTIQARLRRADGPREPNRPRADQPHRRRDGVGRHLHAAVGRYYRIDITADGTQEIASRDRGSSATSGSTRLSSTTSRFGRSASTRSSSTRRHRDDVVHRDPPGPVRGRIPRHDRRDAARGLRHPVTSPRIAIRGISHAFGSLKALDDVSLTVGEGGFVALLGVNGAGKTTLVSLVTRLYDNVSGTIAICGHDLRRTPGPALAQLGVVFQSRALDADLTVAQNLAYHAALHGLPRAVARDRAAEVLAQVDLADRAGVRVAALSGGQAAPGRDRPRAAAPAAAPAARRADDRPRRARAARGRRAGVGRWRAARVSACSGPRISSTRSRPRTGGRAAPGPGARRLGRGGDRRGRRGWPTRFLAHDRARAREPAVSLSDLSAARPGDGPSAASSGARAALHPPARAVPVGAGAAARVALHLRGRASGRCSASRSRRPTRPTCSTRST